MMVFKERLVQDPIEFKWILIYTAVLWNEQMIVKWVFYRLNDRATCFQKVLQDFIED